MYLTRRRKKDLAQTESTRTFSQSLVRLDRTTVDTVADQEIGITMDPEIKQRKGSDASSSSSSSAKTDYSDMLEDGRDKRWRRYCKCSRRTKWIICGVVATPFIVFLILIIAGLVKMAFIDDPYERLMLTLDAPVYMNLNDEEMYAAAERLAAAISIRTISYDEGQLSLDQQAELNQLIEYYFPEVHNSPWIDFIPVNTYSRLYKVHGTEETANPYLLMGHMDVVPEGAIDEWSHDPFDAGIVNGNTIFGRGAIDCKHQVFGILETLEFMIKEDKQPKRSFYIAFGHDEEVSGHQGAEQIAKELEQQLGDTEKLSFILDEGMFVMEGLFPGVDPPVIYIGVAEKGWATVDFQVSGEQGHSSTPPRESSIGILANGMRKLEENRHPDKFGEGVEKVSIDYAAPHASFIYKFGMGNLWLTEPFVAMIFAADPDTDAVIRTTNALTIFEAGVKENVMPAEANAVVNHRLHPADPIEDVLERDIEFVDDDRIKVTLRDDLKATPTSPYDNDFVPYQVVANSALEVWSDGLPIPGLMVANTDTIHYLYLCDAVYRFSPVYLNDEQTDWFHGIDEQISFTNYRNTMEFYYRLILNSDYDLQTL